MTLALEGIKVLDLSRTGPGAFCTMMMADLGAEVLKIEALPQANLPRVGSGISPENNKGGRKQAAYSAINRNKKSIGLNLRSEEGLRVFLELAKNADVIVEGFRPGVVKRLGIDWKTVRKANPRIIYCSISSYGQNGPYKNLAGHDINFISTAGVLGLIGKQGGPPIVPLNLVGDYGGGAMYALSGILAALLARGKTGRGQYVDISMTDATFSMMVRRIEDYFSQGVVLKRGEDGTGGAFPWYTAYKTKDRKYISIGCAEPEFWQRLCRLLGREDLIPFQWARGRKRKEAYSFFTKIFLEKTSDEWFEELWKNDIPVSKVLSLDEALSDRQIIHRKMIRQIKHPEVGRVNQIGVAIKLSDTPGSFRSFAPVLGQHTDETLRDLGYNEDDIYRLRRDGIVG